MSTKEKQEEIKKILKTLGWSVFNLADLVHEEKYEPNGLERVDKSEIKRLEEKIKKHLSRPTTKEEVLNYYLTILYSHPEYKNCHFDTIPVSYMKHDCLDESLEKGLCELSRQIDNLLSKKKRDAIKNSMN
ncbi:hypothetical protein OSB94_18925 [Proteus vulgaris]|uniref:hypothetical protein n=1 Tax=Proteus vulgaris TaxID=585 RepID=UPI001B3932DC|nr:hypothetical protein [Proteus vulgaris]MBQ0212234.1 hypothetical protein [Proteus vulgaris]MDS0790165.1 hypothetical protein [Proteus vulgaris]HEM7578059.1 hypothetical protein [Serratia marcescens]